MMSLGSCVSSAIRSRALAGSIAGAVGVACGVAEGFEELGDELLSPDVGYIDSPGRQIAAGRYRRFSVRAPTLEDRYVAAFSGSTLVLIRFEENGEQCEIGTARSFGISVTGEAAFGKADLPEPLLPYLATRDDDGRGDLRFSDFSCESRPLTVPDVPLPRDSLIGPDEFHLIVRNGSRELLAIDPWGDEPTTLGQDVSFFEVSGERLWSIEQGQLVLRDAALVELGRAGTAVSEVVVARSPTHHWAAYIDGGLVYTVTETNLDTPSVVSDDSCRLNRAGSSREKVLTFFSPCDARRLVVYDGDLDERFDYVEEVVTVSRVARAADGFDLNYWTGDAGDRGTFWIALSGQEPRRVFEDSLVLRDQLFRDVAFGVTGWNGESGNYVSWRDGVTHTIATGVAELNHLGVIANFSDGTGDLLRVNSNDSTEELGSGVPLDSTRGRAFVGNAQGGRGELFVIEQSGTDPRSVASGVTRNAFLFSVQIETLLMMLSDYDDNSDTATLQVRLLDTGDQFEVSDGVSELVEVGFPRPGILYGVPVGDREGLWFAGVR